ncbi:class II aldolase/adducin family protein [Pyrolobus fumarii 1A]|uniref:Class II aldolase/adducin family protein n=1 Tax=Pyrolobus fumarii (strain DSM 11204 / 1A) TaxID=694429 RepID=G0EC97_PYRF1|nr:class II aldolase/adducin family protein [Pyrolobus fumarii 1A]
MHSELVVHAMRMLYERGLVDIKGGNVSVRFRLGGIDGMLVTPGGVAKNSINPDDVAIVLLDGSIIYGKPSSEYRLHLEIYRRMSFATAVVHAHNPLTVALGESIPLEPFAGEALDTCVTIVPHYPAGSKELAIETATRLEKSGCRAAILSGHGVVAVGEGDPKRALINAIEIIEALEYAAWRALATLAAAPLRITRGL